MERHIHIIVSMPAAKDEFQAARDTLKLEPAMDAIRTALTETGFEYKLEQKPVDGTAKTPKTRKARTPRANGTTTAATAHSVSAAD